MFNRYNEFYRCDNEHNPYIFQAEFTHKEHAKDALIAELNEFENNNSQFKQASPGKSAAKQSALVLGLSRLGDSTRNTAIECLVNVYDKFT